MLYPTELRARFEELRAGPLRPLGWVLYVAPVSTQGVGRAYDGNNGESFFSHMQLRVLGGVWFVLSCRLTLVDRLA